MGEVEQDIDRLGLTADDMQVVVAPYVHELVNAGFEDEDPRFMRADRDAIARLGAPLARKYMGRSQHVRNVVEESLGLHVDYGDGEEKVQIASRVLDAVPHSAGIRERVLGSRMGYLGSPVAA